MTKFYGKRYRFVDIETMQEILKTCNNKICYPRAYDSKKDKLEGRAFIEDKLVELHVTLKWQGKKTTFVTYKDGRDYIPGTNGLNAFNLLNRFWKVPRLSQEQVSKLNMDGLYSASPLLDYNSRFENKRIEDCWCYDLNSAYSAAMLKGWIDASKPPQSKKIEPWHEVGFKFNDEGKLEIQEQGYCMMVFERIETPQGIKDFVNYYYEIKKNAKTQEEKLKAKQTLNFAVGYLQKVNPWLRAWVVCSCNRYIERLLDEDSLFWNTDSITSKRRRFDLEENLGIEVGQWKIEHHGAVAYKGNCYQWDLEVPTYRGTPKKWFPEGWDILKDPRPIDGNLFKFDFDTMSLEEK